MSLVKLPIDELIPKIIAAIKSHSVLIVQSSPGSGKTTRIPPALLKSTHADGGKKILVLVPRRLAAKCAALRVAEELGEEVGAQVGYQFRFEKIIGKSTRLIFITEGMLMRYLVGDPFLSEFGCVILDEFHERHLHTDVALALLRHLQNTTRPELKLLVMSATLDTAALARALGDAPVITQESPPHPLSILYSPVEKDTRLESAVVKMTGRVLADTSRKSGHILVFLPGMAMIRRCEEEFARLLKNKPDCVVIPLHGELARSEQERIFVLDGKTKIILATNIAESSLTIDGVHTVIDSGLHRQMRFSGWSGIPALVTASTSKASAIQRAGRAARQGPGVCIRLYSEYDFNGRPDFDRPEIQRSELSQMLLEILAMGIASPDCLPWFEAPAPAALAQAWELLEDLSAITIHNKITGIGREMVRFPLHPRLARLLLAARDHQNLDAAVRLTACISEGIFPSVNLLGISPNTSLPESVRRTMRQINAYFDAGHDAAGASKSASNFSGSASLSEVFFYGFPDRVARRQNNTPMKNANMSEWLFCGGGTATLPLSDTPQDTDFICVMDARSSQTLSAKSTKTSITAYIPISEEVLLAGPERLLKEYNEVVWDDRRQSVLAVRELRYGQIILENSNAKAEISDARTDLFLRHALGLSAAKLASYSTSDIFHALSHFQDAEEFLSAWERVRLMREHYPQLDWQGFPDTIGEALKKSLSETTSAEELRDVDLGGKLVALLPPAARAQLDFKLPRDILLPSGRRSRIHYEADKAPWIASRMQDFFGMKETPKLMDGRIRLSVHLNAPNNRAVQITTDLASFWQNTYPTLRTQLMRRYPRHQWPEKV